MSVAELHQPPLGAGLMSEIASLCHAVFGPNDIDLEWRLTQMPAVSVFLLRDDAGLPIAFKAGFASAQHKYCSWLGGVHPGHRGRGLASQLMQQQHRWLAEQGYTLVETSTQRGNSAMAQLNLRHGFVVSGMRTETDRVQVLFAKTLLP
jgi:GNAT superfamily N-acetyltransferase